MSENEDNLTCGRCKGGQAYWVQGDYPDHHPYRRRPYCMYCHYWWERYLDDDLPSGFKECARCNEEKDFLDFYRASRNKDGRSSYCKECSKQAVREYNDRTRKRGSYTPRKSLEVSAFGERKSITEWSRDERCRVPYNVLYQRLKVLKWGSVEQAMTQPVNEKRTNPYEEVFRVGKPKPFFPKPSDES